MSPPLISINSTCVIVCKLESSSSDTLTRYFNELDEYEQKKYQRYRFPDDKQRFLIGRGLLRQCLDLLYPHYSQPWCIHRTEKGKPYIDQNSHISITHSGDWVGVVISPVATGIDIEKHTSKHTMEAIAQQYFTAQENRALSEATDKQSLFFMLWTLKEAYLKAKGTGLSGGLKSIDFDQSNGVMMESSATDESDAKKSWQCVSAKLDASHSIALANQSKDHEPHFFIAHNDQLSAYPLAEQITFHSAD